MRVGAAPTAWSVVQARITAAGEEEWTWGDSDREWVVQRFSHKRDTAVRLGDVPGVGMFESPFDAGVNGRAAGQEGGDVSYLLWSGLAQSLLLRPNARLARHVRHTISRLRSTPPAQGFGQALGRRGRVGELRVGLQMRGPEKGLCAAHCVRGITHRSRMPTPLLPLPVALVLVRLPPAPRLRVRPDRSARCGLARSFPAAPP